MLLVIQDGREVEDGLETVNDVKYVSPEYLSRFTRRMWNACKHLDVKIVYVRDKRLSSGIDIFSTIKLWQAGSCKVVDELEKADFNKDEKEADAIDKDLLMNAVERINRDGPEAIIPVESMIALLRTTPDGRVKRERIASLHNYLRSFV